MFDDHWLSYFDEYSITDDKQMCDGGELVPADFFVVLRQFLVPFIDHFGVPKSLISPLLSRIVQGDRSRSCHKFQCVEFDDLKV